ncbi:hypothetical protein EVB55_071 [Rhizobium phage RHph_Y68]|uniref:Uncharacterized protein n=1 Tax=Rhizobium phage RHph_Y68 TaxID=2509787 RepID=A0A7S5QY18_9CAUD|nr:lysophospholipase L1-like esterase [Rhizobium phage RHph_Y68]QIG68006.1 hypothetical protein EVB55_071 [Rhizobium phage RHph_Y68]
MTKIKMSAKLGIPLNFLKINAGRPGPDIVLTSVSIPEGTNVGDKIANIFVMNGNGNYTFTKTYDPDDKFTIVGNQINLAANVDFEAKTYHKLIIQADNGHGGVFSEIFAFKVGDANDVTIVPSVAYVKSTAAAGSTVTALKNLNTALNEKAVSVSPADGKYVVNANGDKIVRGLSAVTVGNSDITVTTSTGRTFTLTVVVQNGASVDPNRYMFVGQRNRWMSQYPNGIPAAVGRNYYASKLKFVNAPYQTNGLQCHFSGFACTEGGNAPQETELPVNDMTIDKVYLVLKGVRYAGSFSGNAGIAITSGSKGAFCTFPTAPAMDPDEDYWIITYWHVPDTGKSICGYRIQKHRNEKFYGAGDLASVEALVDADGPVSPAALDVFYDTVGNQTNSQQLAYGPDIMIAKGDWDGRPVVLAVTDSIGHSRQEIASSVGDRGEYGWVGRWLDREEDGRIPYFIMGVPGAKMQNELGTSATLRWQVLNDIKTMNGGTYPFTDVLVQGGTNDNNTTLSTWKSRLTAVNTAIKNWVGSTVPVLFCTIPPQNSTTGSYLTQAVISVNTATWVTNRNALNADIRSGAGFNHNGFIDVDHYVTDYPTNPDKFRAVLDIGQKGRLVSYTPGDGASVFSSGVLNFKPNYGATLLIEYQPGLYGGRTVSSFSQRADENWDVVFTSTSATVFQSLPKVYFQVSADGVHNMPSYIRNWTVPRIPYTDKRKFFGAV